ncbi:flavodoxin [Thermococci archaeon]|nr:MAG: flavodoxin [Thermococci archaeon]RLG01661.1 MAG: flavodoxin [Thermococci archaeon]HHF09558.1 flavodoxin [Methanomicrobia archaeon]
MSCMKALVVYFSRTGNTKKIAESIAEELGCDIEEIVDTKNRSGALGFMRSGKDAMRKSLTKIKDVKCDPSEYDLAIIGTPVWARRLSTPVRTFIHQYTNQLSKVAFFATHRGDDAQNAFIDMEELCGKKPVTVMSFRDKEVKEENCIKKIREFISELKSVNY